MNSSGTQLVSETGSESVSVFRVVAYVAALVALGAVLSVAAAGQGADAATAESVPNDVVVELDAEGDATVTITVPFDLSVEEEATDFAAFAENESKQQAQAEEYETRLSNVAAQMEAETGREMSVGNPSISTRTQDDGQLGLVVLTATWSGLAVTDGDRLVLGPPFDSGFSADRSVAVDPPEQSRVVSTTPAPDSEGEQLRWDGDRSLNGFELVVEQQGDESTGNEDNGAGDTGNEDDGAGDTGNEDDGTGNTGDGQTATGDDGSGPGFGVAVVLLALAALGVAAHRR